MLTKRSIEISLSKHPLIIPRIQTLHLAEKINPKFKNPHIVGGYIRNIILGLAPNDCDVSFEGQQLNQPGILEAVKEAEKQLNITPYLDWEFENISATGYSGDLYEDIVGKYSFHTDYLTMVLLDSKGKLYIGEEEKTLSDFNDKLYDFRFSGIEMWAKHRGNGRSYASCITGDLTRGLYLCQSLGLKPSLVVNFLMGNYDTFFKSLDSNDQKARKDYWLKKTRGNPVYQRILDRFGIISLSEDLSFEN